MVPSMKKISSIIILVLISLQSAAQDRYMVFFKDKNGTPYSTSSPQQFLSERAIQRRAKQNIPVTEEDLPVSPVYTALLEQMGVQVFYTTKWMNGVLVQMDNGQKSLVDNLEFVRATEYVGPDAPLSKSSSLTVQDNAGNIWNEDVTSLPQFTMHGIDEMHDFGLKGEGIIIGVFDDGFQNLGSIPAFNGLTQGNQLLYSFDFTRNTESVNNGRHHGTRVLSLMAANDEYYTGTAPNAKYILCATEAPGEYRIEEYNWLFAAEKADSAGVDIVNTSLGYSHGYSDPSMNYRPEQLNGATTVVTRAANIAASKGILLIVSAGNSGTVVSAPADSPYVLAVGAINEDGLLAGFSSRGTYTPDVFKPDVVAQGQSTLLISVEGTYLRQNGTSFSGPIISGFAAGIWQAYSGKTAAEMREIIRNSGDRASEPHQQFGVGVPNFLRVVQLLKQNTEGSASIFNAYPNPTQADLQIEVDEAFYGERIQIEIISAKGQLTRQVEFIPFGHRNPLTISLQENGVYFVRVITNRGASSRKIIKY